MDNSIDVEDLIEQRKADTAILRHSFLRDENGKVNLNEYGDGTDFKEKQEFIKVSYSYLRDSGLVPESAEEFKKMDYDQIMDSLINKLVVYNYPEYRSVKTENLYSGWSENETVLEVSNSNEKKLNPSDYGLRKDADIYDLNFCFAANYQDISLPKWIDTGINKAIKFIQSI